MKHFLILFLLFCSVVATHGQTNFLQKVVAVDRFSSEYFGMTTTISGNIAVVASPENVSDENNSNLLSKAGAAYVYERVNNVWVQKQKLVASDRAEQDYFGYSLDVEGNYIIVGAKQYREDANGNELNNAPGAAYIFEKINNSWMQVKKLIPADAKNGDWIGSSVKLSGNFAFVAAIGSDFNAQGTDSIYSAGAIYVFENTGNDWVERQKLVANDRHISAGLGWTMDVSGDYLITGLPFTEYPENNSNKLIDGGAAYVFKKVNGTWVQDVKLCAPILELGMQYGSIVIIEGDDLFVAATSENGDNYSPAQLAYEGGAVYHYKNVNGAWTFQQRVVAPDRAEDDVFGFGMAVEDDYLLVGSLTSTDTSNQNSITMAGGVYLYSRINGTWNFTKKIVAPDRVQYGLFGFSIAVSDSNVVVGAPYNSFDENGLNEIPLAGAAYFNNLNYLTSTIEISNPSLSVFPNPSSGMVSINFSKKIGNNSTVKIYDITGALINVYEVKNNVPLDLTTLANGLYLIEINNGVERYQTKWIKE